MQAVTGGHAPMGSFGATEPGVTTASWGSAWKRAAIDAYDRTTRLYVMGDHLAHCGNYLSLDPTYRSAYGDPLIRATIDWTENERRLRAYMVPKVGEIARRIEGVKQVRMPGALRSYDATNYMSTHLQGGAVQGGSLESSVVNTWQRCWSMPNLFVVGGSSIPQNVYANPTLTVVAQALRSADAIGRRYVKSPGLLG